MATDAIQFGESIIGISAEERKYLIKKSPKVVRTMSPAGPDPERPKRENICKFCVDALLTCFCIYVTTTSNIQNYSVG